MPNKSNIQELDKLITDMNNAVEGLRQKAADNQSIVRNLDRISANINLLKIGVSDVIDLL
jgi:hypothetical protein